MTVPWMIQFLVRIPSDIATWLLFGALAIGALVEWRQGHIGRPAIAANALLLWQIFFHDWSGLPGWLQYYLDGSTVIGGVALGSYALKAPLASPFYTFALWGYGSITILLLVAAWTQHVI